jgi:hypothetical protein
MLTGLIPPLACKILWAGEGVGQLLWVFLAWHLLRLLGLRNPATLGLTDPDKIKEEQNCFFSMQKTILSSYSPSSILCSGSFYISVSLGQRQFACEERLGLYLFLKIK